MRILIPYISRPIEVEKKCPHLKRLLSNFLFLFFISRSNEYVSVIPQNVTGPSEFRKDTSVFVRRS